MVIYMKRILCMLCAVCLLFTLLPLRADAAGKASRFHATFLQNWLCRDWTEARWIEEFSSAKAAGFDALILQSTYDIVRGNCAAGGHPQDAAAYSDAESFCMFPSQHAATYHSSQNGGDALELALRAAKDTEMQLWIGTVNDDLWWKFGWGVPEGSYLADWSASNAALCGSLITEMWERYGDTYGEQIAGWYYVNELWNIDAACDRSDDRRYAEIIGGNIGETVRAVTACCPEKPILISPFYNPDVSTVEGFTAFLSDVLQTAAFRPIDIYAGQDGGGKEYTPAVIRAWMLAQNQAVGGKMRFWINHECFNADFTPKPIAQLRENYSAAADLADGQILFSWDHYYAQDAVLCAEFTAFAAASVQGDVTMDGIFDVADLIAFQKWLLAVPDSVLNDPDAADLYADGTLDVLDLGLMKRELLRPAA